MQAIKDKYVNPSLPGSYSGLGTFFRALKNQGVNVKRKDLKEWLSTQDAYTLHKPLKRKFKRNQVIVPGIDDTWQIDLVDMTNIQKYNTRFRYIITCIDVFSKYAWAVPTKNKSAEEITRGFAEILQTTDVNNNLRKPKHLQSDKGTEFFNRTFKNLLNDNNINLYAVNSDKKASIVERFNRTLKEKMYRYFTAQNTYNYTDILPQLIESYNKTFHRTIRMAPKDVKKENEKELWKRIYLNNEDESINFKFNVGDKVRITKYKTIFEKGYTPNWTEEIFIVDERIPRVPVVYKIRDLNNQQILGNFYEEELQKVIKEDEVYKISHIIRQRRNRAGEIEYLVRWLGYPQEFDSWVPASDIQRLNP